MNDLPEVISYSSLLMYADDTKWHKCIVLEYESLQFQDDLNSLSEWSKQ